MVGIEVQKRNNERPSSILKGGKLRRENKGKEGHQGEDQVAKTWNNKTSKEEDGLDLWIIDTYDFMK